MKATGIVRRIDDLGRVVIPKEIRRTLKIHEGSPLEIFTEAEGCVVFRKYSQIGQMAEGAGDFAAAFFESFGAPCCVTDLDRVVAASGPVKKELTGKPLTEKLRQLILERRAVGGEAAPEIAEGSPRKAECLCPIIASGDVIGAVAAVREEAHSAAGKAPAAAECSAAVGLLAALLGRQSE